MKKLRFARNCPDSDSRSTNRRLACTFRPGQRLGLRRRSSASARCFNMHDRFLQRSADLGRGIPGDDDRQPWHQWNVRVTPSALTFAASSMGVAIQDVDDELGRHQYATTNPDAGEFTSSDRVVQSPRCDPEESGYLWHRHRWLFGRLRNSSRSVFAGSVHPSFSKRLPTYGERATPDLVSCKQVCDYRKRDSRYVVQIRLGP